MRSSRLPLTLSAAMFGVFLLFSVLASLRYPVPYGPWHNNTLSELGNPILNPGGAGIYRVGCALTGCLAIAFFLSLAPWMPRGTSSRRRAFVLVQVLGVIAGFALIMNAVYPENDFAEHHFWAGVIFNGLAAAMAISPYALWEERGRHAWLVVTPLFGCLAVVVMFVFASVHWVEWVPVLFFLVSPTLLGIHVLSRTASP